MSRGEKIARGVKRDDDFVDIAWRQEFLSFRPIAIPQTHDAVGDVERVPEGIPFVRRIGINELGGEISVRSAGRHPERYLDRAGDFHVSFEGIGLEDQDISARTGGQVRRSAAVEFRALHLVEPAGLHDFVSACSPRRQSWVGDGGRQVIQLDQR